MLYINFLTINTTMYTTIILLPYDDYYYRTVVELKFEERAYTALETT